MKKLVLILGLVSCQPLTPAQHVQNLKHEIDVVQVGCAVYQLDMKYPRDSKLDEKCPKLTAE